MPWLNAVTELPADMDELLAPAAREGFNALDRLVRDFHAGRNTFRAPGEALFEIRDQDRLVGIGGLNVDPYADDCRVGRLRRVYVHPDLRGSGMGRRLVDTIERRAVGHFHRLQLFTASVDAAAFYCRLGYRPVAEGSVASHVKDLNAPGRRP